MNVTRRQLLGGLGIAAYALPALARFGNYEFGVVSPSKNFADALHYGFDYHEPSVSEIAGMSEGEFQTFKQQVLASPIRCKRLNFFTTPPAEFPNLPTMRVVGDDVSMEQLTNYVEKSLERCRQLGASIVVWGSAGSRNVPSGFSRDRAWAQIKDFLRMTDGIARTKNIVVAIEPITEKNCNIITTGAEALKLMDEVSRPNIRMMIDYYQMRSMNENPDIVWRARAGIVHLHFANPKGTWPKNPSEDAEYGHFFSQVKKMKYHGGISIEAKGTFEQDAAGSLAFFRQELA
jgi:D-psicose/D-tagatose/L-ribulose 3-epimerase